ncbi:hypothetical protein, partial [Pleomorphochaeta sp. DL1XJH-081]|uniref:hypothetical protein n=1 Tax=Pleomorphochaeta sp. DL1XJH-081 TaxID=3409690 RepID=UPI003BB7874B
MAGVMKLMCSVLIAAAIIAAVAPPCEAAIGCGQVVSSLNSCLPYVTGKGPIGGCCNGVKSLYGAAKTT